MLSVSMGKKPTFTQLYIYDKENKIRHKIDAVVYKDGKMM